ncbi:hypothetical protein Q5P01_026242 [Channa striata]|uniref:Uncharacterized protein n=1 Tax=Channa striata TaxID=64152 RepID=A0AA88LGY1_CHASR|nr:hypothetical protein Q5P01_026242 [Channa striata]
MVRLQREECRTQAAAAADTVERNREKFTQVSRRGKKNRSTNLESSKRLRRVSTGLLHCCFDSVRQGWQCKWVSQTVA